MGGRSSIAWSCWTPRLWPESRRSQYILREAHYQEVIVRYLQGFRDQTRQSSGILVEQEEDLSANSAEKVDLTSVHGQPRCCAPLREQPASSLFLT